MAKTDLTAQRLRELLHYDPETGGITRIKSRFASKIGRSACIVGDKDGYLRLWIDGATVKAHRAAWAMHFGSWPAGEIDHINGLRNDNRIVNLRDVTPKENRHNQTKAHSRNKGSGLLGAHWSKIDKKWKSAIGLDGKTIYLGFFDTKEAAHEAYCKAKRVLHRTCTL